MKTLPEELPEEPRAILVVTAHWEESAPTLTGGARPPLIYDYYGFPPKAYAPHLTYAPPGAPDVADRARSLLASAGFQRASVADRGYDHGTFIPMKIMFPQEDVPITQLSLLSSLDPEAHVAMGQALAPLRDEGVLIVCSGMSFHNLRALNSGSKSKAVEFDRWLQAACTDENRRVLLAEWKRAPHAQFCHPREEHLLPLVVGIGAAGDDTAVVNFSAVEFGVPVSGFRFG